jgi:hypothetical protein
MWYHWLIGAIFAIGLIRALYSLVTEKQTTGMYVAHGIGIIVGGFVLRWCYTGITAPAPMIAGRRR